MKLLLVLLITTGVFGNDNSFHPPTYSDISLIYNNPVLYKYYELFHMELKDVDIIIPNGLLGIKYLLSDEGMTVGPDLKMDNMESIPNKEKGYILFSTNIMEREYIVKAAMYKELTLLLDLNLTASDSKVLMNRTTDYDYSKISNDDYQNLFKLIKERMNDKYLQIIIPI